MIGRSGERGSGISVLAAQHDDDDDYQMFIKISFNIHLKLSEEEQLGFFPMILNLESSKKCYLSLHFGFLLEKRNFSELKKKKMLYFHPVFHFICILSNPFA